MALRRHCSCTAHRALAFSKDGTYVTTLHRPIHLTLLLLHRKHNLHVRPGRERQQLHGLLRLRRTTRCACPLPPCTRLWRQALQLLLPARDLGVLPSLEHFSLISEHSFSDDGRNSVLPAHSFTESVLLMRLRHISPILTMGRGQTNPVLESKCC